MSRDTLLLLTLDYKYHPDIQSAKNGFATHGCVFPGEQGNILAEVVYMIEKLACKLGRNDEIPNIELAEYLYQHSDTAGIKEIVDGL